MAITNDVMINHAPAFVGQVADIQISNKISKVNTDTVVIPYGYPVVRDGENGAKMPTASSVAKDFVGVAMREYQEIGVGSEFGIAPAHTGSVVTMGVVWVVAGADVTAGDAVYFGVGADVLGKFCKVAGSGATLAVAIAGAKFVSTALAGELVKVSLAIGG